MLATYITCMVKIYLIYIYDCDTHACVVNDMASNVLIKQCIYILTLQHSSQDSVLEVIYTGM